jgi:phosphodiesterase/alkaline phosphatase D-like protein
VSFEYGTTTKYGNTVTATQSPIAGNTVTNVSANISGLIMGTVYHYRIKATNSLGTTSSKDMTFKTKVADIDGN